jgi:predicted nuclease of predicted toxin-antitoxin system
MDFKVDENLPVEVADSRRQVGHDAVTVLEEHLGGASDPDVAAVCQTEKRVLVTLDTDFADIRHYPPAQFSGFIVLRLRRQDKPHVLEVVDRLIPMLSSEPLDCRLWIVEETRLRIRD